MVAQKCFVFVVPRGHAFKMPADIQASQQWGFFTLQLDVGSVGTFSIGLVCFIHSALASLGSDLATMLLEAAESESEDLEDEKA